MLHHPSLTAEVRGRMRENVVRITSTMIPGKAGDWSRAGHSKASKGQPVFTGRTSWLWVPSLQLRGRKWIHSESVRA